MHRCSVVQAEDAHQAALAALSEEFASEIDEAYAVVNNETEKIWRLRDAATACSTLRTSVSMG